MHKDASGRDIQKGSYVVYAVTQGSSSAGLRFAVVTQLKSKAYMDHRYDPATQNYIDTPSWENKIQVVTAKFETFGENRNKWMVQGKDSENPDKPARVQTIDRLDRVIVLEPHQVNPEAKEALDREMHSRGQ